jgi:ABC-2 type transport system ATP-binding protein
MADQAAIWVEKLSKRFGDVVALDDVSLAVPLGTVCGLLGPNGAGKTTLVRILATLLPPGNGRASVLGQDVVTASQAVRSTIGLSGQYSAVDGYLTGRENLRMIGRLAGLGRRVARQRADRLLEEFDLTDAGQRTTRTYSGGMRRRLDVAVSLVAQPKVLFLDEPTTGLDPRGRISVWRLVGELTDHGTTVLLTQYLEEADRLAHTVAVLDQGRVIASGTPYELKASVGGDRLELRPPPDTPLQAVADAMSGLGSGQPRINVDEGSVVIPVADGPAVLADMAGRLASNGLRVLDVAIRRPSLDDVFFTLTGQPAALSTGDGRPSRSQP